MALHSFTNVQVQVETKSKAVFANSLIDSQYLLSPGQSIEHYKWRLTPVNMTVVFTSSSHPFSISPPKFFNETYINVKIINNMNGKNNKNK